jgi:hypothetical protein
MKINDGLVLAADSAASIVGQLPDGQSGIFNVYNNANKIFNLRKGLPIGAITWGMGSIGLASISTLMKDLRRRFSDQEPDYKDWVIDRSGYTIKDVAERVKQFFYDELYVPAFKDWPKKPGLGFIVGGYSSGEGMADEYTINIGEDGKCSGPKLLRKPEEVGVTWSGVPEAINRLVVGHGTALPQILQNNLGVPPAQIPAAMQVIQQGLKIPLVVPAMPLQDAIDLAEFLVDLTIKFTRFAPGAPSVGGPIEIAAISKHEQFRWVKRKYYFETALNPEDDYV